MKISESWLREWANPAVSSDELMATITMAGLEVDGVEPAASDFSGVVVAEIVAIEQHPDAEKLRVCQVSNGVETVQVVCGAPNARQGLRVAFAQLGACLPGDFKIKKAKLRGVESFGMLCGASELGFEDKLDGLMELPSDAPIGKDLREYLQLNDQVIEVDLTPNRGDCLSIKGLAREVAVLHEVEMTAQPISTVAATTDLIFPVSIEAGDDCPIYVGRVIEGVDLSQPTPLWMQEKLRRGGIRSIDAVVDVTNYILLELGQPMHAFDKATLDKGIVVRKAKAGETLTLLDGQTLNLKTSDLVIADNSKALALAGIMGGKGSGVSETTQDIVLESAFFAPLLIAGRARSYGLHTDSSHRFERGVDWQGQVEAIERATSLLLQIVGGKAGPVNVVESAAKPQQKSITLTAKRLQQVLGFALPSEQVVNILQGLGIQVVVTQDAWQCLVPSWRFDLSIEVDLIEEIARIYGYNHLPIRQLVVPVEFQARSESQRTINRVRHQLVAAGYQEAITYSFIEPSLQALFDDQAAIAVTNPISADMSVMRTSLLPGLVNTMMRNRNRQQSRVRLFETGLRFVQQGAEIEQTPMLAGLIAGERFAESWLGNDDAVDFFDLKGDIENLLAVCGHSNTQFKSTSHKALHPGQSAELVTEQGETLGVMGALHPELAKNLGIHGTSFVFELSLTKLLQGNTPKFKALSKFPLVRRDLALIVDAAVNAQALVQLVRQQSADVLKDCFIFDVYQGKGVEEGKKSVALALVYQHAERSLQDDEVQGMVDTLLTTLASQLGAVLRN